MFKPSDGFQVHITKVQSLGGVLQVSVPGTATILFDGVDALRGGPLGYNDLPSWPSDGTGMHPGNAVIDLRSGIRLEVMETYSQLLALTGLST